METAKFLTAGRNYFTKSCFSEPCTLFTEQWVFSLFQTKPHKTAKWDMVIYGQDITSEILNGFRRLQIFHCCIRSSFCCIIAEQLHADGLTKVKGADILSWSAEVTAVTAFPLGRALGEPTALCSQHG